MDRLHRPTDAVAQPTPHDVSPTGRCGPGALLRREATVKTHLLNIYTRLGVGDRAAAVAAGLYAAISPWVVHFRATNAELAANNLIIGIALAAFGLGLGTVGKRMYRLCWTCAVLGVWMVISPWVVTIGHSPTSGMIWNNVLIGAIVCALGLAASGMTMLDSRRDTRH